eukprot:4927961-Amphidinium_carterae.2
MSIRHVLDERKGAAPCTTKLLQSLGGLRFLLVVSGSWDSSSIPLEGSSGLGESKAKRAVVSRASVKRPCSSNNVVRNLQPL